MARRQSSKNLESKAEIAARRSDDIRHWFGHSQAAKDMRTSGEPKFPPTIIDDVCERIVGGESLTQICEDKDMPSVWAIHMWQRAVPEIRDAIAAARCARADLRWDNAMNEIEALLDEAAASGDKATVEAAKVEAKIRFDAYKFEVGKLLPAMYGDAADKRLMIERAEARANGARGAGGETVVREIIEVPAKEPAE